MYNRETFSEYDQDAYEADIIDQLTDEYFDFPTLRSHALDMIYWIAQGTKCEVLPLFLVRKVEDFLKQWKVNETTDRGTIVKEIAPRVLSLILRTLKPEFFLSSEKERRSDLPS